MKENLKRIIRNVTGGDSFERSFQRHADFQEPRTQMRQSTFWWVEKMGQEQTELWQTTWNEPTEEQKDEMLRESADVFLTLIGYWQSFGISPQVARMAVMQKLDEIEQRYPVELFDGANGLTYDQNYALARGQDNSYLPEGAGTEIEIWNSQI